ncbi:MAG TPA: BamA/TamA family outer membrane protein, partial [Planctomycetota bacterium]|nr:BamA/TamA family outer membrane protein [Planctomycetota bacterium]
FRVAPGATATVAEVVVVNPGKSREAWVRERVELEPGDPWTRPAQRRAFTRLWSTGVFDGVTVELGPPAGEDPTLRPLEVTLSEFPSREFFVEPGYGSYEEWRVLAGFRERNLFGTGRGLRLEGLLSTKSREALLGLTDRALLDSGVLADLTFKALEREEPSFTREEYTAALALSWAIRERVEGLVRYQYTDSQAKDVQITDPAAAAAENDLDISSIAFAPRYDSRDNVLMPASGLLAELALEWGGGWIGSELDFVRPSVNLTAYLPLAEERDAALAVTLRSGVIVPTGDIDPIPLQERYFNGGSNTVRAFEQDELGPVDADGNPLGGETFGLLSVELRRRIAGGLHGAAFVDAGNVLPDAADYFSLEDVRWGPGLGVRWLTPVGPLRFDVAWNPDPKPSESDVVLHFALGVSF